MASFKVMHSSNSRNSDHSRHISSSIRSQQFRRDPNADQLRNDGYGYNPMTVEGIFGSDPPATTESTLLDGSITLMDTQAAPTISDIDRSSKKSDDEVWREIVSSGEGKEMKEETHEEIMTLEDFLAKAGVEDVKIPSERYGSFDQSTNQFQMIDKVEGSIVAFENSEMDRVRGKRARMMNNVVVEPPLDKAAAQRQRRMIKNRESAARSRERKQAYQVELESLAAKLEQENELLTKEIEDKKKERFQKLIEFVIPVVEKPKQPRFLRRIRSLEW